VTTALGVRQKTAGREETGLDEIGMESHCTEAKTGQGTKRKPAIESRTS